MTGVHAQGLFDNHFPVTATRHSLPTAGLKGSSGAAWSLVVPAGWVSPLWHALAFAGCYAAGLREWHWAATAMGMPSFPNDFPDTPAAAALAQACKGCHWGFAVDMLCPVRQLLLRALPQVL